MDMELTNQHLTRQSDIIPMKSLDTPITVIGAGAVGSFAVLQLAKMGFYDILVYDDDVVSIENMNSQFYRFGDIGKPKVEALYDLVLDFTGVKIKTVNARYQGESVFGGIVISAVDSMSARKLIWDTHEGMAITCLAVIDPRMSAEEAQMYVMSPMSTDDIKDYAVTLYSDDNAVEERCTEKATVYTACLLSAWVVKAVKDLTTTGTYPRVSQWSIKGSQLLSWKNQR